MLSNIFPRQLTSSSDDLQEGAPAESAPSAARAMEETLARHLSRGRGRSDAGHVVLSFVAVFAFWGEVPATLILTWLLIFLVVAGIRVLHRRWVIDRLDDVTRQMDLLRRDVWSAAALWAFWPIVLVGASDKMTAILMVLTVGLIAVGSSTLVADRTVFRGFLAILATPLVLAIIAGGLSQEHVTMLLVILLYVPLMLSVHRQAHEVERTQISTNEQLRRSREEATRQRDFLDALMAHAPSSIIVLDHEGRILTANPAFAKLANVPMTSIQGRLLSQLPLIDEERIALDAFLKAIPTQARLVEDLRLTPPGLDPLWVRLTGARVEGLASETTIILGEDVTAQVESRNAMAAAQVAAEEATRSKSAFLASMSHEIRTPMNGIIGMIGILLDTPLNEEQRDAARIVQKSADGLLGILNDILDVSKIEAGQLHLEDMEINLPNLVEDVVRIHTPTATSKGTELIVDVASFIHQHFRGDSTRITQILNNLVSNAIKFTHGGEIVVTARPMGDHGPDSDPPVTIGFSVRDSGIGIPEEKVDMIFREFEQADQSTTRVHGGTGLGLSISRRLVEMMGGRLRVESEVGVGSEFHFQLELPAARGRRRMRREVGADLNGRRFLVVDDNETARHVVHDVLSGTGADVDQAADVDRGLTMMRDAATSNEPYDAVIIDHLMPGKDGFDFAEAVKSGPEESKAPLLMLTSSYGTRELAQARELGIAAYHAKPVRGPDLIRALSMVLGREEFDGPERRIVTKETLARGRGLRILVAEDNRVNQKVVLAMLRTRGHAVDIVENGRLAVEAVLSTPYDIVLMDVEMPEMDGLDATRRIRSHKQFSALPILALTAHAFTEQRDRCTEAGMDDFIAKPIKPATLYATLEKWEERVRGNCVGPGQIEADDPRKDRRAYASQSTQKSYS